MRLGKLERMAAEFSHGERANNGPVPESSERDRSELAVDVARHPSRDGIVTLQRFAGNRAVNELLRVQRQDRITSAAVPVNMSLDDAIIRLPDGGLVSRMRWASSTGDLSDLRSSGAQMREVVRYDPIPNPPFTEPFSASNPVILDLSSQYLPAGVAPDRHIGKRHTILRAEGTSIARQTYEFRPNPVSAWQTLARFTITRRVFQDHGRWIYRVTKAGVFGNVHNESRL